MYGHGMYPPILKKEKIIGFCALVVGLFVAAKLLGFLDPALFVPNESLGIISGIILILLGLILTFSNDHHGYY